jgi:hypothetical protein
MTRALIREELTTARVDPVVDAVKVAGAALANPLVDVAAAALGEPLRHVYALLWRAGVLTIPEMGDAGNGVAV